MSAYVKPGPKAQRIKTDKITINIDKKVASHKDPVAAATNENSEEDNVLKTLEEECFAELKNAIAKNFPELKSVYLALPIECFREIAEKLPQTKAEMLEIDQMTHFRFERFGSHLLQVCKEFNAKRMNYLEDKQLAEMMAKEEEANVFSAPTSSNPMYQNDSQRRSGWMGKSVSIGNRGRGGSSSRGGGGRGSYYKKRGSYGRGRGGRKRSAADSNSPASASTSSSYGSKAAKKPNLGLMSIPKAKAGVIKGNFKML